MHDWLPSRMGCRFELGLPLDNCADLSKIHSTMRPSSIFKELVSGAEHLALARLSNCALFLLAYADAQGGLGLTPGRALKRVHVNHAAEVFDWPGYTPEELYRVNKVLNEEDVFPLWMLHRFLLHTRHARHSNKMFQATKAGRALIDAPSRAFNEIVPRFLLEVDHADMGRVRTAIPGRLAEYLDALNLAAGDWICVKGLAERLLGPAPDQAWDPRPLDLYVAVLRPLIWCGLLLEEDGARSNSRVMKSPLWHEALVLPSDEALKPRGWLN
ncbi:MAG: hypothetical protein ACOYJ6_18460 [Caulobacterales bacterium]